jgi:hypothetical protein
MASPCPSVITTANKTQPPLLFQVGYFAEGKYLGDVFSLGKGRPLPSFLEAQQGMLFRVATPICFKKISPAPMWG